MEPTAMQSAVPTIDSRMRAAQREWAGRTVRYRVRAVRNFRHFLAERHADLANAIERDVGKPAVETMVCETLPLAEAALFLERNAVRILKPRRPSLWSRPPWLWGQGDTVYRKPRGIVGIIGTWNFPLFLNGVQILQALAAGNAVVWKPSEFAPASAATLADLIRQAEFPDGVFQAWPATREGGPLLAEADVDHIVFTGHSETGRRLAARLGQRLISSTLELSGHDVMMVLEDADIETAARAVWFAMTVNAGQTCLAARRIFVASAVHDAFVEALRTKAEASPPMRLVSEKQAQAAQSMIEEAAKSGAKVFANSIKGDDPRDFPPSVLVDVKPEMAIAREAIFVPAVCVMRFDRDDEALAMMQSCPYGLGASIFTANISNGIRLACQLSAGMVSINDVVAPTSHPATPFGGLAGSGWGVTQGEEGLLEMTVPQVVSTQRRRDLPHHSPLGTTKLTSQALLQELLKMRHAAGWRRRMAGLWGVILQLVRG